jgi:hypothetical protein
MVTPRTGRAGPAGVDESAEAAMARSETRKRCNTERS